MHSRVRFASAVAASALLLAAGQAAAADRANDQARTPAPNAAANDGGRCMTDLRAFNERMNDEGYWLSGWGAYRGYGVPPARPGDTTGPVVDRAPWGPGYYYGPMAPSYQMRTLNAAARVLALRDDQQGCRAVLSELRQMYDGYVADLRQAGVEPGEITNWRMRRIVAAQPVEELGFNALGVADVTGADIRNLKDEQLGVIDDVIIDAETGEIGYVVVSHGGFLGIGDDEVAIPWKALKATPGLNMFVLDVPERVMEQAPTMRRTDDGRPPTLDRPTTDQYWQDHTTG